MAVFNSLVVTITWPFFYEVCKEKKDEELRKSRTLKACNSFYKGLYFMISTLLGYYILRDEPYLSPYIMGKGDMSKISDGYPLHKWPENFKYYFLGTLGYHLH